MTNEDYNSLKKSLGVPDGEFGVNAYNDPIDNDQNSGLINYYDGIPTDYATIPPDEEHPLASGKRVLRKDLNAIGNLGTREYLLTARGGYHTFDANVAEMIGGYALGAILDWYQESTKWMRKVRCIKAIGMDGATVDGNCKTPIEDPVHGVNGTGTHYWEIVDVKDEQKTFTKGVIPYTGTQQQFSTSPITMPFNGELTIQLDDPNPYGKHLSIFMGDGSSGGTSITCPWKCIFMLKAGTVIAVDSSLEFTAVAKEVV